MPTTPPLVSPGACSAGRGFPNTTWEFGDRTRIALAHSVGAGWRSGGTPPTQTRHMPAGGAYRVGTAASSWASRSRTDSGGPYRCSVDPADVEAPPESRGTRTACAVWADAVAGGDSHASCSNTTAAPRQRRRGTSIMVPALHNRTEVRTPFLSSRSTADSALALAPRVGLATVPSGPPGRYPLPRGASRALARGRASIAERDPGRSRGHDDVALRVDPLGMEEDIPDRDRDNAR